MKNFFYSLFLFMFALTFQNSANAFAEDVELDQLVENLPKMLGATNVGNDFWLTVPPGNLGEATVHYTKLYISSAFETEVTVEIPALGYKVNHTTKANGVIEFAINSTETHIFPYNPYHEIPSERVYVGKGIHVSSEDPIIVYCVMNYKSIAEGFLALPTSALGDRYVVASYNEMEFAEGQYYPSVIGVVSAYDSVHVDFILGGNVMTTTVGGMQPGELKQVTLNKGDVWMCATDKGDLTGSIVMSDKPVALVSGNSLANIPVGNRWAGYIAEMNLPVKSWGKNYPVAIIPGRLRSPIIRVFAKEDNTTIYRDGASVGFIRSSGGMINDGYLEMRLVPFDNPSRSAVISGDKPIGVTMYNPGSEEDANSSVKSAPFSMSQIPVENYQKEITFCAPGIQGGDVFPGNYINLIYETDENGFMDNSLEIGEASQGIFQWMSVKTRFAGDDEVFNYNIDGKTYAVKTIELPPAGLFKFRGERPFAVYSFGSASLDSYGYPASAVLSEPGKLDVEPPVPTYTMDFDGNVSGHVTDYPDDAVNRSNLSSIFFHKNQSSNFTFECGEYIAGRDYETNWELKIIDSNIKGDAFITFTDLNGNDTTIHVIHPGRRILASISGLPEGPVETGDTVIVDAQIINPTESAILTINDITFSDYQEQFTLIELNKTFPFEIPAGDSFTFRIQFAANNEEMVNSNLVITYNEDHTKSLAISFDVRSDIFDPYILVSDVDFGDVRYGDSLSHEVFIQNVGADDLYITGLTSPGLADFTTDLPEISQNNQMLIEPEESRSFTLFYTPATSYGQISEEYIFSSNADESDSILRVTAHVRQGIDLGDIDLGKLNGAQEIIKKTLLTNHSNNFVNIALINQPKSSFISVEGISDIVGLNSMESQEITFTIVLPEETIPNFRDTLSVVSDKGETAYCEISASILTGVEEEASDDDFIDIFPNPAKDYIVINTGENISGNINIMISGLNGSILYQEKMDILTGRIRVNTSFLNEGAYFITIEGADKTIRRKFNIAR